MNQKTITAMMALALSASLIMTGCGSASDSSAEQATDTTQAVSTAASSGSAVSETAVSSETNAKETVSAENIDNSIETENSSTTSKALVIYFDYSENIDTSGLDADAISSATLRDSANGNNTDKMKMLVSEIQEQKDADVFSIQVNEVYAPNYDDMVGQAKDDIADNKSFTFKNELADLTDYDTVYFGTPIWWSELPQPVHVFFQQYDFSGKTIIPFVVHRGSRFGRTVSQMKEYEPDAVFIDGIAIEADIDNDIGKEQLDAFLDALETT